MKISIPVKTVERLAIYRRLLKDLVINGQAQIFSHNLAKLANNSPAQVRRDLMTIGYSGNPRRGYTVKDLLEKINSILNDINNKNIALVGIGNLGRAILSYFSFQQPALKIAAAFDEDESKAGRVIAGCRCYHIREFKDVAKEQNISLGIITVPAAHAQSVAEIMADAGIRGILNFAPVPLRLSDDIFTDRLDISAALEKVAYFAGRRELLKNSE